MKLSCRSTSSVSNVRSWAWSLSSRHGPWKRQTVSNMSTRSYCDIIPSSIDFGDSRYDMHSRAYSSFAVGGDPSDATLSSRPFLLLVLLLLLPGRRRREDDDECDVVASKNEVGT